jgi:AmpD protein
LPAQYRVLAEVVVALMAAYPSITTDRITGHSDVAPERKTDPGPAFDWQHLWRLLDDKLRRRFDAPVSATSSPG